MSELLSELLVQIVMMPMKAVSVLKHVHLTFDTKVILRELFRTKMGQFVEMFK